jgi:hypothetical protein
VLDIDLKISQIEKIRKLSETNDSYEQPILSIIFARKKVFMLGIVEKEKLCIKIVN